MERLEKGSEKRKGREQGENLRKDPAEEGKGLRSEQGKEGNFVRI
jgi:hypothetical protein